MLFKKRRKASRMNTLCAEEEQIPGARTKQHEDKEEDTGIRPAGREQNKGTKGETRQQEQNKRDKGVIATAFALPQLK